MSEQIHHAIQALEADLEASQLRSRRIELALVGLREIYGVKSSAKKPRALRNGRTDGRTDGARPGPKPKAARSLPSGAHRDAILAELRRKSPRQPGELAKALGMNLPALRHQIKQLGALVVVTGNTLNRQIAIKKAGKPGPKEVP